MVAQSPVPHVADGSTGVRRKPVQDPVSEMKVVANTKLFDKQIIDLTAAAEEDAAPAPLGNVPFAVKSSVGKPSTRTEITSVEQPSIEKRSTDQPSTADPSVEQPTTAEPAQAEASTETRDAAAEDDHVAIVPVETAIKTMSWASWFDPCASSANETAQEEMRTSEETRDQSETQAEATREAAPVETVTPGAVETDKPELEQEHTEAVDQPKEESTETAEISTEERKETEQPKEAETPVVQPSSWGWFSWLDPSPDEPITPPVEVEIDNDEDASTGGKVFSDLQSLPASTRGDDMTISGATMQTTDFDGRDDEGSTSRENVEALVENKVRDINETIPTQMEEDKDEQPQETIGGGTSEEARRLLLVRQLRKAISTHGRYDVRVADISAALGDLLNESKEHNQAVKLHRDATSIYSAKKGDADPTTIESKLRLGQVLEQAGKYDEAIAAFYSVMVMQRALKGEKDPKGADALVHMANALRSKGDYPQAIKELKRALKIYREALGDSHEKVSTTVDEIASLYVTIGDFEKSAAILEEVVKLKAATVGMKSDAVAVTMISLATTYECSEQFEKAMKSLKKAYKIYTELGGYSSEKATSTLNRIAQLYEAIGDNNRASIAYLGVLRGRKINLGDDHLKVGEIYYKLGHSLRKTGQLEKALKCMKEALPIYVGKGVEMNDVEMIAEVMHEMALINKEKKYYSEASRIFKQELSVRRKIGQPEYPLIARTLSNMGVVEYELKNHSRALKYLVESLTIFQERGEHGIDCAEVLLNTGLVFEAVKNKDRATDAFTEAARIFEERGYKEDQPLLATAKARLAKLSS